MKPTQQEIIDMARELRLIANPHESRIFEHECEKLFAAARMLERFGEGAERQAMNAKTNTDNIMSNTIKPPIKSGWRGNLNGAIEDSDSSNIKVAQVALTLDPKLAWALCNVLCDSTLNDLHNCTDAEQRKSLSTLGAALGRLIDHPAANNGGRELVK